MSALGNRHMGILEGSLGRKVLSVTVKWLDLRCLWDVQEEAPHKQAEIGVLSSKGDV